MAAATSVRQSSNILVILLVTAYICESTRLDIFSTKTAYNWVYTENKLTENELMTTQFGKRSCTAVHVEALLRHGARFPGYKRIRRMSELHKKLKLTVTNKEFSFLDNWENDFPETESEEKNLVDMGEDEQYDIGGRFAQRLLKVFGGSMKNVRFVSSSKQRTRESAKAFYEGFTEVVLHEADDSLIPEINDDLLRFHDKCERYISSVESNRTFLKEHKLFAKSPAMMHVLDTVAKRLGLEHATLDAGEVKLIYFLCAFEMIILERDDWCRMLREEQLEVLEYHNDLKQYWKKAYGHPIMGRMACPLVNVIFSAMDKHIQSIQNNMKKRGSVATFYFGHAETLAPLYAALGLYNDSTPLLASNFETLRGRRFKTSQIMPFSSNIALVLYSCGDDSSQQFDTSDSDYAMRLYVNERPEKIPVCQDYICRYADVRNFYKHHIESCDFNGVCRMNVKHEEL